MYYNDFQNNGFLVIQDFFDKGLIKQIHKEIYKMDFSSIESSDIVFEKDNISFKYIQNLNHYCSISHKLISSNLLNIVKKLLNEDSHFVNMEIHNKIAYHGTETPMHQDNFYFRLDPPSALTAYVPLEMHNAQINGGLKFIKGSNKHGTLDHSKSKTKAFSSGLDFKGGDIYETDLDAGYIVFHHSNTIHFADKNESKFNRNSISIRFNGNSAKINNKMHLKYLENLKFNRE